MEAYRYITGEKLLELYRVGELKHSKRRENPLFIPSKDVVLQAFPDHPLLWGVNEVFSVLYFIKRCTSSSEFALVKFDVDENDSTILVREAAAYIWDQVMMPLPTYRRGTYRQPELLVPPPVAIDRITHLHPPEEIRRAVRSWAIFIDP